MTALHVLNLPTNKYAYIKTSTLDTHMLGLFAKVDLVFFDEEKQELTNKNGLRIGEYKQSKLSQRKEINMESDYILHIDGITIDAETSNCVARYANDSLDTEKDNCKFKLVNEKIYLYTMPGVTILKRGILVPEVA